MKEREFYEGKFKETIKSLKTQGIIYYIGWLYEISFAKERFFDKHIKGGRILDVGCGGGKDVYKGRGECIGVDLSISSLKNARTIYDYVIAANLNNLPFRRNVFDYVISSDVLGHIPNEKKDICLNEVHRVLRKDGKTIHYIETEGYNPIHKMARREKQLYKEYFIDLDGHYGLEKATDIEKRFKKFFSNVKIKKMYPGIWTPSEYLKRFDNEYKKRNFVFLLLVYMSKTIQKNIVTRFVGKISLMVLSIFCSGITPKDYSDGICIIGTK